MTGLWDQEFPDCFVTVVDTNSASIAAGQDCAVARGLGHRIRFAVANFFEVECEVAAGGLDLASVDIVVGLHSCGGLR